MASSKADATVRPGSSTVIPPATMKAKSSDDTGSQPLAPRLNATQAIAVARNPPIALW